MSPSSAPGLPSPFLKVCGITRLVDAERAATLGATVLGFVFWPRSPRYVTPDRAAAIIATLPPGITAVGVFVDEPVDAIQKIVERTGIGAVQLHGDESPAHAGALAMPLIRAVAVDEAAAASAAWPQPTTLLVDAIDAARRGGTGQTVDWQRAAVVARNRQIVLAGGLDADNVAEAIRTVQPFGVDVASGVEESPGIKDHGKMARFLASARRAFEER